MTLFPCAPRRPDLRLPLSRAILGASLVWLGAVAHAQPATLPGPAFPAFASAAQVREACRSGLADIRQRLRALEQQAPDGQWLGAYDRLHAALEDGAGPIDLISNVSPRPEVRQAAEACALQWQDFSSSLYQNRALYAALAKVEPADDIDRLALQNLRDGFEDAGVGLPAAQRAKAKRLNDRIGALAQKFDQRIRDAGVRVAFTEAELSSVPRSVWDKAPRDKAGRVLLGLDYPSYLPVIQRADSAAARERMWRAKTNEGGAANLALLDELARLRREYAALFGFSNYADFALRRNMAQNLARAEAFLDDVKAAVRDGERRDVEELRQAKVAHLNTPPETTRLERWDVAYYSERLLRERLAIDQESFRPYFPPRESLQFTMRLIEKMMGVRYTRVDGLALWHPEVQAYAVSDAASGQPLAALYVDLYPREGKYNHAAVWSYRGGSTLQGRLPQAALVVNFNREGLTLEELETLLHELGHAVHSNLSATRYAMHAGTSVKQDFVEAPSQMLEDWVYDAQVLKVFAEVCPACKPVPPELLAKALAARDFGKGLAVARQHLYASYDLALYGPRPEKAMPLWARMEGDTPLGHVRGTLFPAGFSHIASNYSAGYYGYLWSLVVAMDLRTAFQADRLDAAVGARYRRSVLGQGGQREPQALLREFLGRETNAEAFNAWLRR